MAEHALLRVGLASQSEPITKSELIAIRDEIGTVIGDPMWCAHSEVSKVALKRWHNIMHRMVKAIE
jgi:hypothetical protein